MYGQPLLRHLRSVSREIIARRQVSGVPITSPESPSTGAGAVTAGRVRFIGKPRIELVLV